MKNLNQQILDFIEDEQFLDSLRSFVVKHREHTYADLTLEESHDRFLECAELLKDEIESGRFDVVAHNRRNAIFKQLQTLKQNLNNVGQVIQAIEAVYDHLTIAGLFYRRIGSGDIENELKDLTKLKRSITDFRKKYSNTKKNLEFIDQKKSELETLIADAVQGKEKVKDNKEDSNINLKETETVLQNANATLDRVKEAEKKVEEKRLSIDTFSENIDEYKTSIASLEKQAKELLEKRKVVDDLIMDSREALKLGSARGISQAFAAQYEESDKEEKYKWWVYGAVGFIFVALVFTAWAIGGWGIEKPDSINSILGRVVGVGVSIAAAVFCANQYVRQKNIAEDYAYKATLSKSIVAFMEEIAKSSQAGNSPDIAVYLSKVLDEIHKDPLRSRQLKGKPEPKKETLDAVKDLIEMVQKSPRL